MNQKVAYSLIDTAGQTTAVIDIPIPRSQQPIVAKPLMNKIKNIKQVCFIEKENGLYRLQMMGNELSVNGSLAGAFYLSKKFTIKKFKVNLSGVQKTAEFFDQTILFPELIKSVSNNLVEMNGIIYKLVPGFVKAKTNDAQKIMLKNISKNYNASGLIYYENNKIQPLLYVKDTNTFVWESCCGSTNIAYAVISNQKEILQPSGEKVLIKIINKDVIYSARCGVLI